MPIPGGRPRECKGRSSRQRQRRALGAKKGLFRWLAAQRADVVWLQELKCHEADLDARLHGLKAFSSCYCFAEKKGYSGVALLSRKAPDEVKQGFASREFDAEGRYVEARFGNLWVISVYLPSGSAGAHRQASKFRFLKEFIRHLGRLKERGLGRAHGRKRAPSGSNGVESSA